jgi:hypothetical protein
MDHWYFPLPSLFLGRPEGSPARGLAPRCPSLLPLPPAVAAVAAAPSLPKVVGSSPVSTTFVVFKRGAAWQARAAALDSGGGRRARRGEGWASCGGSGLRRCRGSAEADLIAARPVVVQGGLGSRSAGRLGMPGWRPRSAAAFLSWMERCSLQSGGDAPVVGLAPRSGVGGRLGALCQGKGGRGTVVGVVGIIWASVARMHGRRSSGSGSMVVVIPCLRSCGQQGRQPWCN